MAAVPARSVELAVTSPPYPMIEMWDESFARQDSAIREALERLDGWTAFRRMHGLLDRVWRELHRALVDGGIACINIGDATRTVGGSFALYPNHARILTALLELGFTPLPAIIWRKQTNAPNKFMGSGMFPPGAYVTLEHEHVLIVRKGEKRAFPPGEAKSRRRRSAYFWEERNQWFSDVWFDLKGSRQELLAPEARERSGAFPFELPYRLISMFSVKGDTVIDPFLGAGTTMLAAMAAGRNSVGYEIDRTLAPAIASGLERLLPAANVRIGERIEAHAEFIRARHAERGPFGYRNEPHGFPVVTRQEMELELEKLEAIEARSETEFEVRYAAEPEPARDWSWFFEGARGAHEGSTRAPPRGAERIVQLELFESG
jgi:DNA modification methylase